tara:strand:+ start:663 stop:1214 length:552 start_codon:yes stop_codon:yes gene_type:complete
MTTTQTEFDFLITYVDEDNYHSTDNLEISKDLTFQNRWNKRFTSWLKENLFCISSDNYSIDTRLKKIHMLLNIPETYRENNYSFPLLNNYLIQTQSKNKRKRGAPLTIVFAIKYQTKFMMVETNIRNDWRIIQLKNNQLQIAKFRKKYLDKKDLQWKTLYALNPYDSDKSVNESLNNIIREFR